MSREPTLTLLEILADAVQRYEAFGLKAMASDTRAAAARLREEWARWEGDMDGAGGVVARVNGGPVKE